MELNITHFFKTVAPMDYSASAAELGQDAGIITWRQAVEDAPDYPLLDTEEKREAFRDHARSFGAWSDDEIAAWSDDELTALLIQMISGDIRDADLDTSAPDWDAYQAGASEGTYSGSLYVGDDGQIYYWMGN